MTRLICLEPSNPGPEWEPFRGARPIAELRAGAWRIRDRWAAVLGSSDVAVMGDHANGFADADAVPTVVGGPIRGPAVVARSDFAPSQAAISRTKDVRRLVNGNTTVAWIVPEGETWQSDESGPSAHIEGFHLSGTWELIAALEQLLPGDCDGTAAGGADPVPAGSIVLGNPERVGCFGAEVEPGVVFDVRLGAVVMEEGVRVHSGTRLEGPLFVGPHSMLLGGTIRHCSIGPYCRVHGEVASTVFLGYANKSHDGFVGHSVLGHWVNLGAGTITSNLKNTYGEVRLDLPGGRLETGRTNLGTLFGDHSKTAIGTRLSTGTVIGTGAQVLHASPPRYIAPFSWGDSGSLVECEGFVTIAKRVMPRRKVEVTTPIESSLRATYARLAR
jgi:UDP-N-acetylglucosamine diphosphorylase/glucosamine-1-phosphate N-acetyltransferase